MFIASSTSEEDDNESDPQTSSTPNTSALETLVRTACESLAVSTLLAETPSASINQINAPGQPASKDGTVARPNSDAGLSVVASSSAGSNLYPGSTSTLDQSSSADDAVFSVLFGNSRDQNVTEGTTEGQSACSLSSKELPESALNITQGNLSEIGDVEVIECAIKPCFILLWGSIPISIGDCHIQLYKVTESLCNAHPLWLLTHSVDDVCSQKHTAM